MFAPVSSLLVTGLAAITLVTCRGLRGAIPLRWLGVALFSSAAAVEMALHAPLVGWQVDRSLVLFPVAFVCACAYVAFITLRRHALRSATHVQPGKWIAGAAAVSGVLLGAALLVGRARVEPDLQSCAREALVPFLYGVTRGDTSVTGPHRKMARETTPATCTFRVVQAGATIAEVSTRASQASGTVWCGAGELALCGDRSDKLLLVSEDHMPFEAGPRVRGLRLSPHASRPVAPTAAANAWLLAPPREYVGLAAAAFLTALGALLGAARARRSSAVSEPAHPYRAPAVGGGGSLAPRGGIVVPTPCAVAAILVLPALLFLVSAAAAGR